MSFIPVYHYEAFTDMPHMGNPAGVILDADRCTDEQMQAIAKQVGYNECCFVCSSSVADVRFRYFTPGHEMPLCGHATMAALTALMDRQNPSEPITLRVETMAGIFPLTYSPASREISMAQANAQFVEFSGDRSALLASIGLDLSHCDDRYPIVYGSTGTWTLILPVKGLDCFSVMQPHNECFPQILTQNPRASVHPITTQCFHPGYTFHARHFSSPFSGTVEDPVTGTASGVMAAYYLAYMSNTDRADLLIEQGREIGKDGTVRAIAEQTAEGIAVRILGRAVFNAQTTIAL